MLALAIYMLFILSAELVAKPFKNQNLNFLLITSTIAITGLFFSELLISVETIVGSNGISITKAVAIIFVLLPHLLFYFFIVKEFQHEIIQWCYYRSQRLFRLITCGLVSRIRYGQKNISELEKHEESIQRMVTKTAQIFKKSVTKQAKDSDIVKPEHVIVDLDAGPATQRSSNAQDTSRARLYVQKPQLIEMSEEKLNQDVEAQVNSLVRQSSPAQLQVNQTRILQRSYSQNFIEKSTQQKILVDDEAIQPESSQGQSEIYLEDDVRMGSVNMPPPSDQKQLGPFQPSDEIFQQLTDGNQSFADVSVSQVHLEERKQAQNIQLQKRTSTLPPVIGVSSKARSRVQGTISVPVRDVYNESRPDTENSDKTIVNAFPSYITAEKTGQVLKEDKLLKKGEVDFNQVLSRFKNLKDEDLTLPRFGTGISKLHNVGSPVESQEGENVDPSPLKLRNAISMQEDAPPIRTTVKRKFV